MNLIILGLSQPRLLKEVPALPRDLKVCPHGIGKA